MTTLILIRHGESQANRKKVFAGHFDVDLQDKGLMQAEKTAEYIVENYKVDKVYASDLMRAYKTGKCVADLLGIEVISNAGLREIHAGSWEGKSFDTLRKDFAKDYEIWLKDIGSARCTDGESTEELGERVMKTLTQIALENDGKTVVIATHATSIRVVQTLIQHGSLDEMKNVPWVSNASVSVIEYSEGEWKCTKTDEHGHLDSLATVFPANV